LVKNMSAKNSCWPSVFAPIRSSSPSPARIIVACLWQSRQMPLAATVTVVEHTRQAAIVRCLFRQASHPRQSHFRCRVAPHARQSTQDSTGGVAEGWQREHRPELK
jgi:hypothetical protein